MGDKHRKSHILSKIERYPKHTKIRIGYFSADFRNHAVAYLIAELFEIHDRDQFEIFAFSHGPSTKERDPLRRHVKPYFDGFYEISEKSTEEVVNLSQKLKINGQGMQKCPSKQGETID